MFAFLKTACHICAPIQQKASLGGGTGRRARLKIVFPRKCRFDSGPRHKKPFRLKSGRLFTFILPQLLFFGFGLPKVFLTSPPMFFNHKNYE